MADIKIATGVEKININDKVTLEFNPTDVEIVEKILAGKKQDENGDILEMENQIDEKLKELYEK